MNEHGGRVRVARLARVVTGVRQTGFGYQQPTGGTRFGLLRFQADAAAAAGRVEVHYFRALQPHHRAGRRRMYVHRTRKADGAALFHVHLGRSVDVGLGRCKHTVSKTIIINKFDNGILVAVKSERVRRVTHTE